MKKRTLIESIIQLRCPRCRQGKLFSHKAYNLKHFNKMHEKCSCCGKHYMLEPSFFEGAMYVSYAIQVAIFITVFTAVSILAPERPPIILYIAPTISAVVLLAPVTFRLSRSVWIHFFVKYDAKEKYKKQNTETPDN